MAAVAARVPAWTTSVARARDAIWSLFSVARTTAAGVIPVALRAGLDARSLAVGKHDSRAIARAVVISLILLVSFGALLLHGDPLFASLLVIPPFDIGRVMSHLFIIGLFTWIVGGSSRAAFDDASTTAAPEQFGFTLSALDITMSVGALNSLFATFVGTQLAWFFGGDAYLQAHTGLTTDRFYSLVFMAWLAVVLVLIALTVLRDRGPLLLTGAPLSGFVTLAALNLVNPDVIIAHVNIARTERSALPEAAGLDLVHLSTLGGDAVGLAATAIISNENANRDVRCAAARTLLKRWGATSHRALSQTSPNAWRKWNVGEQRGLASVGQASTQLLAVVANACPD
jgi:hypothetical protein